VAARRQLAARDETGQRRDRSLSPDFALGTRAGVNYPGATNPSCAIAQEELPHAPGADAPFAAEAATKRSALRLLLPDTSSHAADAQSRTVSRLHPHDRFGGSAGAPLTIRLATTRWSRPNPSTAARRRAGGAEATRVEAYAAGALAPATRRAYATDWRAFATWCWIRGLFDPGGPGALAARGCRPACAVEMLDGRG